MSPRIALLVAALALLPLAAPGMARAECYADYKAKQDDPLRLHYGVAQVSECDKKAAKADLAPRLRASGWQLLSVISTFGPEGLGERQSSAGEYFLRF